MPKNNTSFNVKVETGQEVYGEILTLLRGYSPYELALKDGFVGTEEEWLASLVGEKGEVGDGIEDVVLNDDYTLTIFYTNGDQYTTPHPIRGETGATGNGIKSATLNPDYTLTLLFTDGGSYTTIPIRGLQGERGLQGIQGIQGETGNGISRVKLNPDYTLTIYFTDGTSNTTSPIRGAQGEKGETGNGIKYATMNSDYTLTIKFTDGSEYTTPVLRGAQGIQGMKGDVGNGIDSAVLNSDYTLTLNFTDGTSYTTTSIRGQAGERGEQGVQGEPGNGIAKATLNPDYTLTLSFTDGSSYTTSSIRGMQGIQGIQGATGADGVGIASATMNQDYTLTLLFTDGTHYTTPSLRGATGSKGDKGDTGNGIDHVQLNNDYTLTFYFDDGTQYTTASIRGEKGEKGEKGDSGDSPTITTTKSGKRTTIYADDSPIGTVDDGTDGHTPVITATKSGKVTTIKADGTTIAEINDGNDGATGATGASGSDGKDGKDGADGFSPTATVSKSGSTATITITDKNGTTMAEVHDGQGGTGTIDPTPTEGSTNAVSSGGVYDELTDLKSDLSDLSDDFDGITEDYSTEQETVVVNVPLDLSDIRVGRITSEGIGTHINVNTSSVSSCALRTFTCEANKTYTLTITNGATPAKIAQRTTVIVFDSTTEDCVWEKKTTNTSNATDIVEFTPTAPGKVCFNLDKNFQSISVTTTEIQSVTVKTAKDLTARDDISDLKTAISGLDEDIDTLSETVSGYSAEIAKIDNVTEMYSDGSVVETPVQLNLSDIRVGKRTSESGGITFTNSTVTSCVVRAFNCEAGKTYKLTITNGATPAKVAQRATVVVATGENNLTVADVFYSTNSTNPKDVVEFTPTTSGTILFNVDKNFQSVSVVEVSPHIVPSAVDCKARDEISRLSGGIIQKEITWESGSFDANLEDASGNGYRSNLITGVKGQAVCVKVNPSYTFTYGDGLNPLVTTHGVYVIHPKTDTIRIGISDTAQNTGVEVRIYKERGRKGKYDVIVAASDSADEDKLNADIVCDGTNDELDIQFAVNWNFDRKQRVRYNDKCNVLLLPGTYNIDKFTQFYTAYGQLTREKYGVMFGNDTVDHRSYVYRVSIEGCYETEHSRYNCSTLINVTDAGVATLGNETLNAVFGIALLADGTTGAIRSNALSVAVQNLGFYLNGVTNKIICIDAYQAGNVVVKNCDMWTVNSAYLPPATTATAPEGSIGIRAGRGSCLGVRQRIEGNRIQGFHDGISLCGEHFIIQDNLEISCVYGFSTNQYPVGGAVQHPNIFIGNSVEQCLHMGRLGESGMRDTLIYIGGSVENTCTAGDEDVAMLPIEISASTQNRGRIESDSLASPYNNSFFEEGRGSTFVQTIYPYYQA